METIYVVFGKDVDEYEREKWPVVAYKELELANQHAEKATEYSRISWGNWCQTTQDYASDRPKNPYDPFLGTTESQYGVWTIDIAESLPVVEMPTELVED